MRVSKLRIGIFVTRLASGPTVAIGVTKWLLNAGDSKELFADLADEAYAMELSSRSPDFRQGLTALVQHRDPCFKPKLRRPGRLNRRLIGGFGELVG